MLERTLRELRGQTGTVHDEWAISDVEVEDVSVLLGHLFTKHFAKSLVFAFKTSTGGPIAKRVVRWLAFGWRMDDFR